MLKLRRGSSSCLQSLHSPTLQLPLAWQPFYRSPARCADLRAEQMHGSQLLAITPTHSRPPSRPDSKQTQFCQQLSTRSPNVPRGRVTECQSAPQPQEILGWGTLLLTGPQTPHIPPTALWLHLRKSKRGNGCPVPHYCANLTQLISRYLTRVPYFSLSRHKNKNSKNQNHDRSVCSDLSLM